METTVLFISVLLFYQAALFVELKGYCVSAGSLPIFLATVSRSILSSIAARISSLNEKPVYPMSFGQAA